jgi:cell division protease FtsH
MNGLYEETKRLMELHLPHLEDITVELLEKESLSGEDIERICA